MIRNRLKVAYDGSAFCGWQSQPSGKAVQDELEAALLSITGSKIRVHGSGRTDAGVHALGQVAHFDADKAISLRGDVWKDAINAHLNRRVRVLEIEEVEESFHARFSAKEKCYRYCISRSDVLCPLDLNRVWHVKNLDINLLEEAVSLYQGEHDFLGFAANRGGERSYPESGVRNISSAVVNYSESGSSDKEKIEIEFRGNGFLYKMVRLMVGNAVKVACRQDSLSLISNKLEQPRERDASDCAPAEGLFLVDVFY